MINYEKFNTTENHSFNLYNAVKWCRDNECDGFILKKYRITSNGNTVFFLHSTSIGEF